MSDKEKPQNGIGAQPNSSFSQQPAPIGMPGMGICAGAYMGNPMPGQGWQCNNSNNAPKTIHSSVITQFSTNYFVYDKEEQSLSGHYYFTLKPENGKLILKEDYKFRVQEEVTPDVFDKIQKIIKDNNLVASNGVHDVKQGLPAEYQPCHLEAVYDSGEVLNFTMNSMPYAPWAQELAYTLRMELAKRGHKECLAPPSATHITNFRIEFLKGDLSYSYGMINDNRHIERCIYNTSKDDVESEKIIEVDERFYADLNEYIISHNLTHLPMPPGVGTPPGMAVGLGGGDFQFYEMYIEYENGKTFSRRSDDATGGAPFYKEIPGLKAFFDHYIDDPNAKVCSLDSLAPQPFSIDSL